MAPFLLCIMPSASPPWVQMYRNTGCDSNRDGDPQYNDLFLTTDPHTPVKLSVEQNENLQDGFDWRVATVWVVGANLEELLMISTLSVEVAQDRRQEIHEDYDASKAMYESGVDALELELMWRKRFKDEGVYEFVRKVDGRRDVPQIYWQGTST